MVESKQLLPLGSIVLLEEGLQKLIIVGRGAIYRDQVTQEEVFADYMGAIYPIGVNPETTIFFQNENKILIELFFVGFRTRKKNALWKYMENGSKNSQFQRNDQNKKNPKIISWDFRGLMIQH